MKRINGKFFIVLMAIFLMGGCAEERIPPVPLTYSGENPRVQDPLSPEESMTHIQVPEGFEVELFASEPEIINPVAFAWDERGRLWVVQSQDYPHGLENEVGGDRITICEDTNGDGKADKFTDFAIEQPLTSGIMIVKGGAIVAQAPHIIYLEDEDGDDVADKRTVILDGFGTWDTHAGPSNLKYGVDNMLWGSVGYSGFENTFQGKTINFKSGVFRFSRDGSFFEPVGQFDNNTWGLGFNENFEIFGSTANNNHCCYVGIPLRHYHYLNKMPSWGMNADFIQGHYEINALDTLPLQQVDVRGGFTAASGANFYTATNYPEEYRNQMYVCEPTGYLVHRAKIEGEGAGYKEVDGGNIFASTDAWVSPVHAETGPDGNLWVADWYNPVIQHNPDHRGMDNQIWNTDKGEGNAHINPLRDYEHGRIYRIVYKKSRKPKITSLDRNKDDQLIKGLDSDNMFWRITAQRMIVEDGKASLIPELISIVKNENNRNTTEYTAMHAIWALDGLGAFDGSNVEALEALYGALSNSSFAVQRAAVALLPSTRESSDRLAESGILSSEDTRLKFAGILKAGELPESGTLFAEIQKAITDEDHQNDKWINAAINLYFQVADTEEVDPGLVEMIIPASDDGGSEWQYTTEKPSDNWMKREFDDSQWSKGVTKFGGANISGVETIWEDREIWLRKEFDLREDLTDAVLKILHDDDYEVYVNGEYVVSESGAIGSYKYLRLGAENSDLFRKGKNLIAVRCINTGGDQYIDVGIGKVGKIKADVTFMLEAVSQKMAFDKTLLHAEAGQTIEIILNNKDQMPHNLVLIRPGTLEDFGAMVDEFVTHPTAKDLDYIPPSKYYLASTPMLDAGEVGSLVITLPDVPGIYPYVCTFPGHWSMMQGEIIVSAPGSYISENPDALRITSVGGGGSHDFLNQFGINDGEILSESGENTVIYTEDIEHLQNLIPETDILFLSNNQPLSKEVQKDIFQKVNSGGLKMMIYHPATWYNWSDWPEYNKELVGGGSHSHEDLQEFEVEVIKPEHPIMAGVPDKFRIVDELYRWEQDPDAEIEVLAIGRGLESGDEFPVVWTVKHPASKIVANTLGHDERAHQHPTYKTMLKNSLQWLK